MSEQVEMRECPFCGRHNIGTDYGPYRQWVQCFCHDCGASAASCDSEVLAIAAWNKRAAPKPAPEALHGYWQVEPIEGQMPTITTTYCQGCQEKEAELASLRQEKNDAIGAALAVEQKCYDQAQELAALRKLREACEALFMGSQWHLVPHGPHARPADKQAIFAALAACDEAYKEVSQCPST